MDGQRMTALIDLGVQISSISSLFCEDLTLQIQPLGRLLELEQTGDSAIPYLWYVEVNLQILGIKNYNKDILLLIIPTMTYSEKATPVVGSKSIDQAMRIITKGELTKMTMTWKQAHFRAVMTRSLELPHTGPNGTRVEKEVIHSSLRVDTIEVKQFCLDNIQDPICTTWKVTIPPLAQSVYMAMPVSGNTVCGSMCLQSQCQTPSCLPQWC